MMTYFKTRGLVLILFVCCFREVILDMSYRFTSWALGSIRELGGRCRARFWVSPDSWAAKVKLAGLSTFLPSLLPDSCPHSDCEYLTFSQVILSVSILCFSPFLSLFLFLSCLSFHPSISGFDQNNP